MLNVEPQPPQEAAMPPAGSPPGGKPAEKSPVGHAGARPAAPPQARAGRIDVGSVVRVERDETHYPSRGTWPQFRGRAGTVTEVNRAGKGSAEYGVVFGKVRRPNAKGSIADGNATWFKRYELTSIEALER